MSNQRWTNADRVHRHAVHALEDFLELRAELLGHELSRRARSRLHSFSHHLRHAVFHTGEGAHYRVIPERDHEQR